MSFSIALSQKGKPAWICSAIPFLQNSWMEHCSTLAISASVTVTIPTCGAFHQSSNYWWYGPDFKRRTLSKIINTHFNFKMSHFLVYNIWVYSSLNSFKIFKIYSNFLIILILMKIPAIKINKEIKSFIIAKYLVQTGPNNIVNPSF